MPLVGCSADERNRMKLCLAVPLPRLPVVSHPSLRAHLPVPAHDSFVPLDGEGQRRPGPPLEVACLQTTTNFLDLTNSPTGHRPCASSRTTARPATPTTSPSKKSSRPRQPHRPSWHSWHSWLDASTCRARSPASWTWV